MSELTNDEERKMLDFIYHCPEEDLSHEAVYTFVCEYKNKRIAELKLKITTLDAVLGDLDRKIMSDEGIQHVKQYWHEILRANMSEGGGDE